MKTTVDHNYTGYGTEGVKYQETKELSVKEIAKMIRTELKDSTFDGFKFSVRSDYNHIRISITQIPEGFVIDNPNYDPDNYSLMRSMGVNSRTENANALLEIIEKMLKKYNYDDSDGMIDYFSTKFYSSVSYDWAVFGI